MFSLAYAILCICSIYLALEKDKQNGKWNEKYDLLGGKKMEVKDYLKDELKRLNRRNDLLEKQLNSEVYINCLAIEEQIKNNTLAMCEIAKAYKMLI